MSASDPRPSTVEPVVPGSKLIRIAMWVAIGALIAAAIVCVIWVLVGSGNGLIGRALLTILLLAAFAGAAMLDARLAHRRPAWFALASMIVWVVILLIGAFLIWTPERDGSLIGRGFYRFWSFLLIVLILQLALLHVRLFTRALERNRTTFTRIIAYITMGLVALLAVMLVLPLMLNEWVNFHDIYWRLVVAVTILAAVGTALVPLFTALFAPRRPAAVRPPAPAAWPTYVDGVTALPVLPDGSPDWNAYYTGIPSPGAFSPPPPASAVPYPAGQPQFQGQQLPAPHPAPQPQPQQQQWPAPQQPQQWPPAPQQQPWPPAQQQPQPSAPQQPPAGTASFPPPPPLPPQ